MTNNLTIVGNNTAMLFDKLPKERFSCALLGDDNAATEKKRNNHNGTKNEPHHQPDVWAFVLHVLFRENLSESTVVRRGGTLFDEAWSMKKTMTLCDRWSGQVSDGAF